jgi:hypothetical protein
MRATILLNSTNNINKASSIPKRLNNDSTDNNNITGVNNVIQNEENNNAVINSIDNSNINDNNIISGVDNVIHNGENLINNSIDNININDNIRNNVTQGEKTIEENSYMSNNPRPTLESVDSYPPIFRTDNSDHTDIDERTGSDTATPILRLRGGVGEEEKEGQNTEKTGERFILTTLDEEESEAIGGRMEDVKLPGMICISGCNLNGIKAHQLKGHLQHAMDLQVDIQCYSEVNTDFLQTQQRQKFY